jgi:hypothetical protein
MNEYESPYELLGISPAVTMPELTQAYAEALRSRKIAAAKAASAFKSLQTPSERVKHDALHMCDVREPTIGPGSSDALPEFEYLPEQPSQVLITRQMLLMMSPQSLRMHEELDECQLTIEAPRELQLPDSDFLPPQFPL